MSNQAFKTILDAKIAARAHGVEEQVLDQGPLISQLFELFTKPHAPDYDEIVEAFGREPTPSELCFLLCNVVMTPEEASRVSTNLGSLMQSIFAFNCSEGEQPEELLDALYAL